MAENPLAGRDRREHRKAVARSVLRVVASTTVLTVVYALVPVAGRTGVSVFVRLALGLVVLMVVIAWQLRSVTAAEHPGLRAAEALAVAFVLLVLGFSFTYLSLSHGDRTSFSEHLDRIGALYFTLSVITTVGFGDIVARTHAARIAVIVQFVLNLALIFGVVRLFVGTVKVVRQGRELPGTSAADAARQGPAEAAREVAPREEP